MRLWPAIDMPLFTRPHTTIPPLKRVQVIVASQVNILVQPISAEACEFPVEIANECQSVANMNRRPVVLLDAGGDRHTFEPYVKTKRNTISRSVKRRQTAGSCPG